MPQPSSNLPDVSLPSYDGTVFKLSCKPHVRHRRWIDVPLACEYLGRKPYRGGEVPSHLGHCGEEQIPKAVPAQLAFTSETKLKQLREDLLTFYADAAPSSEDAAD